MSNKTHLESKVFIQKPLWTLVVLAHPPPPPPHGSTVHAEPCPFLYWGFVITHKWTRGKTPLDKWSARRKGLYLHTTQHINTNIHALGGIRTRDPSNQEAADVRLRPRGHWARRGDVLHQTNLFIYSEINCITNITWRWGNLVQCMTTDWTTGIRSPTEAKDFSSSLCVQTSSEAHLASYPVGTGGRPIL
jgi:hypothetical protein